MNAPNHPQPPAEPRPDDLAALLVRLLKLASFVTTPMKDGVCTPAAVTPTELRVIMALAGEGELAGHDLVEIMGMAPMNVSRAITDLKHRGWVEEVINHANRRRKPVRLTQAGDDAYRAMQPDIAFVAQAILGTLSTRQRREFAQIADKVIGEMVRWIAGHHAEIKPPSDLP